MYDTELEKYLTTLSGKKKGTPPSESTIEKQRLAVRAMTAILTRKGTTWPEDSDYVEYRQNSSGNAKTVNENIKRIEHFFEWLREELESMTEPKEATTPKNDDRSVEQEEKAIETNEEVEQPKSKPGRKRFDTVNGSKKSEKLMLYMTPELIADLRDWCYLKRVSCVSYITALIEADLDTEDKQKKLSRFREMSDDA